MRVGEERRQHLSASSGSEDACPLANLAALLRDTHCLKPLGDVKCMG